jgi:glycosyltransferase involved in cell wall biosynthesis
MRSLLTRFVGRLRVRKHDAKRRSMRRLAVVSNGPLVEGAGYPTPLARLLGQVPSSRYCIIWHDPTDGPTEPPGLVGRHYRLASSDIPSRFGLFVPGSVGPLLGCALRVFERAARIARIARREQATAILACSGNLWNLPAGYLASSFLRLPFYAYMLDDFREQWPREHFRPPYQLLSRLASAAERMVVRRATHTIAANDSLSATYWRRYRASCAVIRNAVDIPSDAPLQSPMIGHDGTVSIVFTGVLYEAQHDAFRNLLEAIALLPDSRITVNLYTSAPFGPLERLNIRGSVVVYHGRVTPVEAIAAQRRADILFLPLAFESPYERLIRTASPGKMAEYLASGRPILAHAPPASFVSDYFRRNACGLLVDRSDAVLVADAIRTLIEDPDLGHRLSERALECALRDFNLTEARKQFISVVDLEEEP